MKALVAEITSEVGGRSVRHSPTGWKQAQGAVGALLQSNLYAQIRALKLDLEARCPGFDLSITHPLFSWPFKHAQRLLNSRRPFRRGKKDFGLAVIRSPTNTLWPHLTVFPRLAHFGDAFRWSRSTKLCWNHLRLRLGILKARKQTTLCFHLWARVLLPDDQPHGEEELFQEAMEHFHEMVQESETRASADVPVQDDLGVQELAEGLLKRAHEPAQGAASSAESSTSRPRVGPPPSVERKRETSDVPEATTKVQRMLL